MPIGIQTKHERDSFDKFLDTYKEPREIIQEPSIPEPEQVEPSDNLPGLDEPVADPVMEHKKLEVAMIPAETIVDVIDTTAVSLNSYIAQEHQEGASAEEKESLKHAVANYLKDTDIDISPGKLCLILILMIYAPKTLQAFQARKQNQENAALRARIQYLEQNMPKNQKEVQNGEIPSV